VKSNGPIELWYFWKQCGRCRVQRVQTKCRPTECGYEKKTSGSQVDLLVSTGDREILSDSWADLQ